MIDSTRSRKCVLPARHWEDRGWSALSEPRPDGPTAAHNAWALLYAAISKVLIWDRWLTSALDYRSVNRTSKTPLPSGCTAA